MEMGKEWKKKQDDPPQNIATLSLFEVPYLL